MNKVVWNVRQRRPVIILIGLSLLVILWLLLSGKETETQLVDIYQETPFCDLDGECHENPDQASPRTIYSARSKEQYEKWWRAHAILSQKAQDFALNLQEEKIKGRNRHRPLIMYGDSITESWLGTDMQYSKPRTAGIPQVFQESLLHPRYALNIFVAAIGGDQTQHLLYRMQHGELLPEFANDPKAVYVVMIGTNNLGSGEKSGPTARGIQAVVNYLLENTTGCILLLKLLPRGTNNDQSTSSFMPDIGRVNQKLDEYYRATLILSGQDEDANDPTRHSQDRITIVDCGQPFLKSDKSNTKDEVIETLMPDKLHPNAEGHRILAECILRGLEDSFDLFA